MKDYTVKTVDPWGEPDNGQQMMSLTFEEFHTEPVDYKSDKIPKVGDTMRGSIENYQTRKGSTRTRFMTPEQKLQDVSRQDQILASWAVGKAIDFARDHTNQREIVDLAEIYARAHKELLERII